jgi:hypothetical protein
MIRPPVLLSFALVLLAGRPPAARPGPIHRGRPPGRLQLAAVGGAALVWAAVALFGRWLADGLSVTPPTVRLAAGIAVAVTAAADIARPRWSVDWRGRSGAVAVVALAVGQLGRVEVGVAVWSLSLDHGRLVALLAVAAGAGVALAGAVPAGRPAGPALGSPGDLAARSLAGVGLGLAVIIAVNAILSL